MVTCISKLWKEEPHIKYGLYIQCVTISDLPLDFNQSTSADQGAMVNLKNKHQLLMVIARLASFVL